MWFSRRRKSKQERSALKYRGGSPSAAEIAQSTPGIPEPMLFVGGDEPGFPVIPRGEAKQLALDALEFVGQNVVKDKSLISQVMRQRALDAVTRMNRRASVLEGVALVHQADHEYEVWQRAKKAAAEYEDPQPEGVSPEQARLRHTELLERAEPLIGRDSWVEGSEGLIYKRQP